MGILQSKLFTEGDNLTVQKLEDCATGTPSQALSHFTQGQVNSRGEHIRRVQQALKHVQQTRPELGIPDFDISGVYDARFAKAIYVYKEKKGIRNYANRIDDIVGMKTIKSLDSDNLDRPHEDPSPKPKRLDEFPRQLPNCVKADDCPPSNQFDVTLLGGMSGGEIGDFSKLWFTIRDTKNGLSALYLFSGYGAGFSATPVGVADGGAASHFTTSDQVRVTSFGPTAAIGSASVPVVPYYTASYALLTLQYRPDGQRVGKPILPISVDTGKISIPGGSINAAHFELLSLCGKGGGATRREIKRGDVVGL